MTTLLTIWSIMGLFACPALCVVANAESKKGALIMAVLMGPVVWFWAWLMIGLCEIKHRVTGGI